MTTTENTKRTNPRRTELVGMSKAVKPLVGQVYDCVNEALKDLKYGKVELNTFKGWIEKGFCVKKGETAKVLWGSPKPFKQKEAGEDEKESSFFPICYVFSPDQVEKIDPTKTYSYTITK